MIKSGFSSFVLAVSSVLTSSFVGFDFLTEGFDVVFTSLGSPISDFGCLFGSGEGSFTSSSFFSSSGSFDSSSSPSS